LKIFETLEATLLFDLATPLSLPPATLLLALLKLAAFLLSLSTSVGALPGETGLSGAAALGSLPLPLTLLLASTNFCFLVAFRWAPSKSSAADDWMERFND
jgi:hypothetical protein